VLAPVAPISHSDKVVFKPFDVILTEVRAGLHLDEDNLALAGVPDPMSGTYGNVDGFPLSQPDLLAIQHDNWGPSHDRPLLGPMSMAPSQLGAFTRSSPDKVWHDLEYHVQPLSLDAFGEPLHRFNAFTDRKSVV